MAPPLDVWIGFGALADRLLVVEKELEKRGLEVIPREKRTTGNLFHQYKAFHSTNLQKMKEYEAALSEIIHAPDFYDKVPPRANSQDAVNEMIVTGLEIRACTSYAIERPQEMGQKLQWIAKHFDGLKYRMFMIPDRTPAGTSAVRMPDRNVIKSGYFIMTDEAYRNIMPGGCKFMMLEEALFGRTDLPLISFDEKSPNYWGNILAPKATTKIEPPDYSGDTSTVMKNASIEG